MAIGQVDRCLDDNVAEQVTVAVAAHALDAFAAQTEDFPGLRFRRDLQICCTVERRDFDFAAQCRGRETDRHLAMQVVLLALEDGVCFEVNLHVQIAGWAAIDAMLAFAGKPDAITFINARGDFDGERFVLFDASSALTGAAGFCDETSGAVALGTGLLNRE